MTTWDYIRDLFEPDDQVAVCWKKGDDKFNHRFVTASAACKEPFQRFLRAMNAQGANVYITMNPLKPGARSRTKQDVLEIRRVYLDIDHDGERVLLSILTSSTLPRPNYVLNTSPAKYQVIWNVQGFDVTAAETLMRSLSREFHTDPATVDVCRVFRLPGLHNKKYDATFRVTARHLTSIVYGPCHFLSYDSTPVTRTQNRAHVVSGPRHSKSERDWAYCCQRLWPDPNDAAVIAELLTEMERRAQGRRSKPRYYAELTVNNARAYMAAKRDSSNRAE
jgi:hypothetical protein